MSQSNLSLLGMQAFLKPWLRHDHLPNKKKNCILHNRATTQSQKTKEAPRYLSSSLNLASLTALAGAQQQGLPWENKEGELKQTMGLNNHQKKLKKLPAKGSGDFGQVLGSVL